MQPAMTQITIFDAMVKIFSVKNCTFYVKENPIYLCTFSS